MTKTKENATTFKTGTTYGLGIYSLVVTGRSDHFIFIDMVKNDTGEVVDSIRRKPSITIKERLDWLSPTEYTEVINFANTTFEATSFS